MSCRLYDKSDKWRGELLESLRGRFGFTKRHDRYRTRKLLNPNLARIAANKRQRLPEWRCKKITPPRLP
ncbi:hypothetical protein [Methylovulum psychrotolerans]|uniref:hypothetical protein n=1 Tax=Methylovulum psychrotolerans TaxID=1704499 RepID=UPI0011B00B6F|nr:hypothetical protein [Methylovulum psychrotolerans]